MEGRQEKWSKEGKVEQGREIIAAVTDYGVEN